MFGALKNIFALLYTRLLGRDAYNRLLWRYKLCKTRLMSALHPYHYDAKRYESTFLQYDSDSDDISTRQPVQRIIYTFWTGNNELSENRKRCLKSMVETSGVKVQLITPKNLKDYILPEHPLHPAYEYLSYVHRADYLRCYFMNFYGGGYSDIKSIRASWIGAFNQLDQSSTYLIGYPEQNFVGSACYGQKSAYIKRDLFIYWRILAGNGAYICRPHTKFTEEWLKEIENRLDVYMPVLKEHPSKEDPYSNEGSGYPIYWTEICGSVFHPLCLKYNKRILLYKKLFPVVKDYR